MTAGKPARGSRRYRLQLRTWAWLGAWLLRALAITWRVRTCGPSPFGRGPFVAALWHEGLFVAAMVWRHREVAVPVSRSRDGDQIEALLRQLGFAESPRGSSSRGATAMLRGSIRQLREGRIVAVLPDGPRGPAHRAKPGVVALAGTTGVPLVPVAIAAAPALRFGSWDRTLLPLPFARILCRYGEPIEVPKRVRGKELESLRSRLEAELQRMNQELRSHL